MEKKKSSGNGFFKFCRKMQRETPEWAGVTPPELVDLCSPLWCDLSSEDKAMFSHKRTEFLPKGGFDSMGRSLSKLAKKAEQHKLEIENMKLDVKNMVDEAIGSHQVEDSCYYLIHTNVFCITAEGGVVPAELSLMRISMRNGIEETFHVFLDPGAIPKGYRADCVENAEATHKIPLDLVYLDGNYKKILEDILEFLLTAESDGLPPLFCLPKHNRQNQLVLEWLLTRYRSDLASEVNFRLYSLPVLLYELVREDNRSVSKSFSTFSASSFDSRVPTITIAEAQLDRDNYIYIPGLSCAWHEDVETCHCTTATLHRWSFLMFALTNPLYELEVVPGKHCPQEERLRNVASQITTTASVCSSDHISSCDEDIIERKEHSNMLRSFKTANLRISRPLNEWDKFGYQEQKSIDLSSPDVES